MPALEAAAGGNCCRAENKAAAGGSYCRAENINDVALAMMRSKSESICEEISRRLAELESKFVDIEKKILAPSQLHCKYPAHEAEATLMIPQPAPAAHHPETQTKAIAVPVLCTDEEATATGYEDDNPDMKLKKMRRWAHPIGLRIFQS